MSESKRAFAVVRLADQWYVACRSTDLRRRPLARTILDEPLVLFRDGHARPTALLDRGLFRGGARHEVTAVVRRFADRVEAEYVGEPRPSGLAGRLLAPEGGTVAHVDRFVLPSISQVEYRLGERSHLAITNALTPETEFSTRIHSVISFRLPLPGPLVRALVSPVARRIMAQD